MALTDVWEQLRSIVFTGRRLKADEHPQKQEEYILAYEDQLERNPLEEWKLLSEAALPVLGAFRKEQNAIERMEKMISGGLDESDRDLKETEEDDEDTEYWIERLYDEIANLETEEEWQAFKGRFISR
jgi:hypothetical protein